ncbi:MAG TPA: sigma-54 dependent transcriptional regulator [Woeseiaceae bacterium]|nr:sigma-54 dependent transcriptional regulator [Woeseiaceae bacterium]
MSELTDSCILVVDQDQNLREAVLAALSEQSRRVVAAANASDALEVLSRERVGLVFSEFEQNPVAGSSLLQTIQDRYPGVPAVVMASAGSIEHAVDVMRDGATDYLVKPLDTSRLTMVVEKYFAPGQHMSDPLAIDTRSRELFVTARRVAATDVTVTISGESGSGKEVLARYMHAHSHRRHGPFIAINCAAIPENMLEALLFGHEKGAFTGATRAHAGKFEQANQGTLLLDEISEMDLGLQAKLLRVIQEKEVERIGASAPVPLNVRVLTATNRNLREWVAAGKFREDLYYRLNVLPLHIPALRDRPADIVPLAELFLKRHDRNRRFTTCAEQRLLRHDWPGNVRELDNLVQRSAILSVNAELRDSDLAFEADTTTADALAESGLHRELAVHEFACIQRALVANGGKRSAVADELEISPRTLRYKLARMRQLGIAVPGESHE